MRAKERSNDWSLLSAYIDGEMTSREKAKLEQCLRANPDLRKDLEQIRSTRAILRSLSRRKAPRSFALTPEMVKKTKKSIWLPVFSYTSAASAMIALLLLLVQFLPGGLLGQSAGQAEQAPAAVALYAEEAAKMQEAPEIIYWGGPPALVIADGKGGGGGQEPLGPLSEAQPAALSGPAGRDATGMRPPEEAAPVPQSTAIPGIESPILENEAVPTDAVAEPTQEALSTDTEQPQEVIGSFASQDANTGPILGLRPEEEGGQMTVAQTTGQNAGDTAQRRAIPETLPPSFTYLFAGLSAAAGIAAYIFWRRNK